MSASAPETIEPVETIEDMLHMFPDVLSFLVLSFGYVDHEAETRKRKMYLNAEILKPSARHARRSGYYCTHCGNLLRIMLNGAPLRIVCQGVSIFGRNCLCREAKYNVCDHYDCLDCIRGIGICRGQHSHCKLCKDTFRQHR